MMTDPTSTPPTRREREQARHRRDILAAAVSLFADNGYHQTTMQMIADRAEFSVGYLYKHFSGKDEIYQDLVQFHQHAMESFLDTVLSQETSPLEQLHSSYVLISRHFNQHRDFMRIFHQEIGDQSSILLKTKKRHMDILSDMITRAQAAGELKAHDPALLAAVIQGASKELFGELAGRGGENPFDELPDTIFKLLIDPLRN